MSQYFLEQGCFQPTERMGVESLAKLSPASSPLTFCLCWSLLKIALPQRVILELQLTQNRDKAMPLHAAVDCTACSLVH